MKGKIFTHSLGFLLLAAYAAVLLFASYTFLIVGHWPSYNNPDPGTLPAAFIPGFIIVLLLLGALLSLVAYPATLLVLGLIERFRGIKLGYRSWWSHGGFLFGVVLWTTDFLFFHVMEPRHEGLLSWFFD